METFTWTVVSYSQLDDDVDIFYEGKYIDDLTARSPETKKK